MMQFRALSGNTQKLDGGAMFGNVPKALWSKWVTPDENNQIPLACRCLLIEHNDKRILLETGIGAFFEPKLKARFGVVEKEHCLLASLAKAGLKHTDIDTIILSHLHFDHAGGLLSAYQEGKAAELLFPNATIVTSKKAFERAQVPHPRDKASFIPTLNEQLSERNLILLEASEENCSLLGEAFSFRYSNGHTPGMLLTTVHTPQSRITFGADLVPGTAWVHLPVTMGYDRYPELLIDEKRQLLESIYQNKEYLFYTHDFSVALSQISKDEKGRYIPVNQIKTDVWALS